MSGAIVEEVIGGAAGHSLDRFARKRHYTGSHIGGARQALSERISNLYEECKRNCKVHKPSNAIRYAATPTTWGVLMEVPEMVLLAVLDPNAGPVSMKIWLGGRARSHPPIQADVMLKPGANTSTRAPISNLALACFFLFFFIVIGKQTCRIITYQCWKSP